MDEVFKIAVASGAIVAVMVLIIPITGIITYHRRKLEEIRLKQRGAIAEDTAAAIAAVRREIEALRDTATQYDVSFDTALHRIESRVGSLEQRMQHVERKQDEARIGAEQEELRAIH
jgi:hypothetical protein